MARDPDPTLHPAVHYAISGEQCAAARAWLRLEITELAAQIGTTRGTLRRFEACENVLRKATLAALREFFEERGIVFVWSPDGYPEGILASMPAWRLDYARMRELRAQHSRRAVLRRAKERRAIRPNLAMPVMPIAPPPPAAAPASQGHLVPPAPNRASPADRERLAALEAEQQRLMAEIAAAKRAAAQAAKGTDDDDEF